MNYDIIGTLYDVDMTDPENPISTELTGFHVNTDQPLSGAEDYVVAPTTPRRVFAGIETHFYAFPDEDTFAEFAPELYPVEPEVIEDETIISDPS